MEIYFLRHGDAGKAEEWPGDDAARPLSAEGVLRMARAAAAILHLRLTVDVILTSPLVRARQTAEIVAREIERLDAVVVEERLAPGFGVRDLEQILTARGGARGIMLVGHEPDFSRVIAACTGGGRVECKKGSLARVDIEDRRSLSGVLAWLLPPRVLAP